MQFYIKRNHLDKMADSRPEVGHIQDKTEAFCSYGNECSNKIPTVTGFYQRDIGAK